MTFIYMAVCWLIDVVLRSKFEKCVSELEPVCRLSGQIMTRAAAGKRVHSH